MNKNHQSDRLGDFLPDDRVKCYPNPFSERTTVQLPDGETSGFKIFVYDAFGQSVMNQHYNSGPTFTISRNGLKPGLYFMKIKGKKTYSTRFMVK